MTEHDQQQKKDQKSHKLSEWQKDQADAYRTYIKTSAVGLEVGLSIAVGALLGYFADKYFGSAPYGLLVGVLVGAIAAGKRLWLFAKKYLEKNQSNGDEK